MVPQCGRERFCGLPFSLPFIVQCILRIFERRNHENLNGDDKELVVQTMSMFLKLYSEVEFDESFRRYRGFSRFLKLNFAKTELDVPIRVERALISLIVNTPRNGKCTNSKIVQNVIESLDKMKNPDANCEETKNSKQNFEQHASRIETSKRPLPVYVGILVEGQD